MPTSVRSVGNPVLLRAANRSPGTKRSMSMPVGTDSMRPGSTRLSSINRRRSTSPVVTTFAAARP